MLISLPHEVIDVLVRDTKNGGYALTDAATEKQRGIWEEFVIKMNEMKKSPNPILRIDGSYTLHGGTVGESNN